MGIAATAEGANGVVEGVPVTGIASGESSVWATPATNAMRLAVAAALTAATLLLAGATPAVAVPGVGAPGGLPADYLQTDGLSSPRYATERVVVRVPAYDGELLYLEVVKPIATGRFPVILEASPYHGTLADRDGTRILPDPRDAEGRPLGLTGYFAPRGYAVVMMDLRGTGRSQGCLDHLGPKDARDLRDVVQWAASQGWSNGRVGMTGHSYVGSTPAVAAAQRPPGLKTIVPSAGLASMYDHQFQAGVPYFAQWLGPIEAYEQIALERKLPPVVDPFGLLGVNWGDDFGNSIEDTGCGLPQSAAVAGEDQLSGRYADWHVTRDHAAGATAADIPVFLVHGVNDDAARVSSMQWFTDRGGRTGDKLWLGQWDHGSGCCPTRRGMQWTAALHAWFDRHLAQREVSTGPPVEIFLSDGTFAEARAGDRDEVLTSTAWGVERADALTLRTTASGGLGADASDGSVSFVGDPTGFLDPQATGGVEFATAPLTSNLVLAGVPHLRLSASVTAPRLHLIANLYDESPDGTDRRRLSQCTLNPELRNGIATRTLVVPGERYDMAPPCFAIAHHLRAGHRLVLRVTTSDPDKVPVFAVDPQVRVFTGAAGTRVTLPVVPEATPMRDTVPFEGAVETGPAQAPVSATVTPTLGLPARAPGTTTAFLEFDSLAQFDNAKAAVTAVPSLPADIDLYLQRRRDDGSWSGDIATGGSSALNGETMTTGRLAPGRYRIEVHNWLGLPGTSVALNVRFENSAGEPGV
jgi:predicted acyl esterase